MELKVGNYVRTYDGIIYKIQEIKDIDVYYSSNPVELQWQKQTFCLLENKNEMQPVSQIKIARPSIIDLIQVGDYVNGYKVIHIGFDDDKKTLLFIDWQEGVNCKGGNTIKNSDIKSVVTKEQFESMEYRIGEDE